MIFNRLVSEMLLQLNQLQNQNLLKNHWKNASSQVCAVGTHSLKLKVPNGLVIINTNSARVYYFILNCSGRGGTERERSKQPNYLLKCYVALAAAAAAAAKATWQPFTESNAITSAQHTALTSEYVRTARENNRYTEEEEGEMKKEKNKNRRCHRQ